VGKDHIVVLCTAPSTEVAADLARGLVDARLAACVNVIVGVRSFYHWKGAVHDEGEVQLVMKTRRARYAALEAWIQQNHPYDVPEVIALPVESGSRSYLDWVTEQTG
jgi:periplasmic divalent cation tolerance protein